MTKTNLTSIIDAYGALMAQRANIEGEKKRMEKALADVPEGAYEGELFRLSISDSVLESNDDELRRKSTQPLRPSAPPIPPVHHGPHREKALPPTPRQGPQRGRGVMPKEDDPANQAGAHDRPAGPV